MNDIENVETWNKKRIFIALTIIVLLIIGAYFFKNFVLNKDIFPKIPQSLTNLTKDIKGISTNEDSSLTNSTSSSQPLSGVQKIIQEKLDTVKQEITTLNIQDIASSSPQFQKIINDLQSLQQYPRNELKDVCQKVCGDFIK